MNNVKKIFMISMLLSGAYAQAEEAFRPEWPSFEEQVSSARIIPLTHHFALTCQASYLALWLQNGGDVNELHNGRTALEAFNLLVDHCNGDDRKAIELLLAGKIKAEQPEEETQVVVEQAQNASEVSAVVADANEEAAKN